MTIARAELARLSELLDEALDLPHSERTAWLERLNPADAALRPRLEAMLEDAATQDIGTTVPGNAPAALEDLLAALPGLANAAAQQRLAEGETPLRQVGPYCLLRPL